MDCGEKRKSKWLTFSIYFILIAMIITLFARVNEMSDTITDLQEQNESLEKSNESLEKTNKDLEQSNESLEKCNKDLENANKDLESQLSAKLEEEKAAEATVTATTSSGYPALYAEKSDNVTDPPNTVYLTFDDGPNQYTEQILDILAAYNVKATFFVTGVQVEKYPETVKRIVDDGHAIGLHSNTHNYDKVYKSVDSFLKEFETCLKKVQSVTDYPVTVVRFPGGTNNPAGEEIAPKLVEEMTKRGFAIFDWDVDSGDASSNSITEEEVIENVVNGCSGKESPIVLMHDKEVTAAALPEIIEELQAMGYQFGVLSNEIEPLQFCVD